MYSFQSVNADAWCEHSLSNHLFKPFLKAGLGGGVVAWLHCFPQVTILGYTAQSIILTVVATSTRNNRWH